MSFNWESLPDWIGALALLLGALYAAVEYRIFRRYQAKVEFDVDVEIHPILDAADQYIVNATLRVTNRSQVRHYLPEIQVGVKALEQGDPVVVLNAPQRLRFGQELIPRHNIVSDPNDPWFVDAGVTQKFPYPMAIATSAAYLQVNAEFWYYRHGKRREYHQASIVKRIVNSNAKIH